MVFNATFVRENILKASKWGQLTPAPIFIPYCSFGANKVNVVFND